MLLYNVICQWDRGKLVYIQEESLCVGIKLRGFLIFSEFFLECIFLFRFFLKVGCKNVMDIMQKNIFYCYKNMKLLFFFEIFIDIYLMWYFICFVGVFIFLMGDDVI